MNERTGYRNGQLIYPISVVDHKKEASGGGGGSCQPGPNTVGTEEIIDGSVKIEDLNKEVTDKLDDTYVNDSESLYINGTKPA